MGEQCRETECLVIGELIINLVGLGYGVAIKRIGDHPRLTAFAANDMGTVEYYATGHTVLECVSNLYDMLQRERGYSERPI